MLSEALQRNAKHEASFGVIHGVSPLLRAYLAEDRFLFATQPRF
jgi:hypothetical protein